MNSKIIFVVVLVLTSVIFVQCSKSNHIRRNFNRPDFCGLPADPGICEVAVPSWYFDSQSNECKDFIYGG